LIRRSLFRFSIFAVALVATVLLIEFLLEVRDVARYKPGQTFVAIGDARIRYRLLGVEHPGSPVMILAGMNGVVEQADSLPSDRPSVVALWPGEPAALQHL
jgi:hypothetical protein